VRGSQDYAAAREHLLSQIVPAEETENPSKPHRILKALACMWRFCCCFYYLFYYLLCCCFCDTSKTVTKQIFRQRFGRWLNLVMLFEL